MSWTQYVTNTAIFMALAVLSALSFGMAFFGAIRAMEGKRFFLSCLLFVSGILSTGFFGGTLMFFVHKISEL